MDYFPTTDFNVDSSVHFRFRARTDKQVDRQTDKQTQLNALPTPRTATTDVIVRVSLTAYLAGLLLRLVDVRARYFEFEQLRRLKFAADNGVA